MSIKANAIYSLNQSRKMVEGLIASLKSPSDWVYQACPKANHPLWIVGHLAMADNMFAQRLEGVEVQKPEGWDELFWFGSEVHSDLDKYPPVEEVLAFFRERRENLMRVVNGLTDEFLNSPTPDEGMFAEAPNMAQMLIFAAYHEGIHSGQMTVAHRGLGHDPMYQPQPAVAGN